MDTTDVGNKGLPSVVQKMNNNCNNTKKGEDKLIKQEYCATYA